MRHRLLLLALLLSAAALRLIGFITISPPGLAHDEVANWLIDRSILDGNHAVYFTAAYGHEAGFHYWQTLFVALLGDNTLALRLPAALMGVMAVAVSYALVKALFNRDIALLSTTFVATLFMPVFFSRLGLRAITLPVTAGLSLLFMWRWLAGLIPSEQKSAQRNKKREQSIVNSQKSTVNDKGPSPLYTTFDPSLLLSALFAGLSSYTYMAARALPILFAAFFIYLALWHRETLKRSWRGWLLFAALYLLLSLPLILFLQNTPTADVRIAEVDGPLRALLAGNPGPVLSNGLSILGSFGFSGDPLWRSNVIRGSGRPAPIFEPLGAILFYIGLLVLLRHIADMRSGLLLAWAGAAIIPSLVTIDAPSTIRMILLLPLLGIFPIVGLVTTLTQLTRVTHRVTNRTKLPIFQQVIHSYPQLSPVFPKLSTVFVEKRRLFILTSLFLMIYIFRTGTDLFWTWPANDEVRFVWQANLTEIAHDLDKAVAQEEAQSIDGVAIAGWSPDSLDSPTMQLSMRQFDAVEIRHFGVVGEINTLIIPSGSFRLYKPTQLPLHPYLQEYIETAVPSLEIEIDNSFEMITGNGPLPFDQLLDKPISFSYSTNGREQAIDLTGYRLEKDTEGDRVDLITAWTIKENGSAQLPNIQFFLHLLDQNGEQLTQYDGLDAPSRFWLAGDQLIQVHPVPFVEGGVTLRLGAYVNGAPPQPQFQTEAGELFILIPLD